MSTVCGILAAAGESEGTKNLDEDQNEVFVFWVHGVQYEISAFAAFTD